MSCRIGEDKSFVHCLTKASAALSAILGLTVLIGWALRLPILAAFVSDKIPMAPSTAVLFLLLGCAILLYTSRPTNGKVRLFGIAIAVFCIVVTLSILILSSLHIFLDVEHIGFRIEGTLNGLPIGHMSPLTGIGFILSSISFLSLILSTSENARRTIISASFGFLTFLLGATLVAAYLLGEPLLYGSSLPPPALSTSLGFLALGTALMPSSWRLLWFGSVFPGASERKETSRPLILIFAIVALGVVAAGYAYFRDYQKHYRAEVENQLSSISELKVNEIMQWRNERLNNAFVFADNRNFSDRVKQFLDRPNDEEARERLQTWLDRIWATSRYERINLLDSHGIERLFSPVEKPEAIPSHVAKDALDTIRSGKITFLDFHRDEPGGKVSLAVMAPIFDAQDHSRALGVLLFRINPEQYLYPMIGRWPTPSKTAETMLVKRDGDNALFLNDLRFQKDSALNLEIPLNTKDSLAVMAVQGKQGIVRGLDYRGKPSIASLRPIPDSPWFLVASINVAEVSKPLRAQLWTVIAFVVVLLLGTGTAAVTIWQRNEKAYYRALFKADDALRKSEERYRTTLDSMMEGCQLIGRDWRYLYLNNAAAVAGKQTKEELLGHTMMERYPGIEKTNLFSVLKRCMEERTQHKMENEFEYPDGSKAWFQLSIQPVPEGIFILSVDITERRHAEEALRISENKLKIYSEQLEAMVGKRTKELDAAHEKLLRKERLALLGQLAGGVGHELRNPLGVISSSAYLLKSVIDGSNVKAKEYLDLIVSSVQDSDKIISDLLDLSRVKPCKRKSENIAEIIAETLGDIPKPDNINVITAIPDDLPTVFVDRGHIKQVFLNIVTNAYQAMSGGGELAVKADFIENSVCVTFKDSGAGISNELLPIVFEPLFTTKARGVGLGLTISKYLVEMNGGRIVVQSELGSGSAFIVTLPSEESSMSNL